MGAVVGEENGNRNGNGGSVSEFQLGNKNKYKRMESDDATEEDINHDSRKFVFACAIFASLNSVLLGYGSFFFFFWLLFQC